MQLTMAPSLMSMDLLDVRAQLRELDPYADFYHVDIIDGHYVRNMCLSPQFIRAIRRVSAVPVEAHLYVEGVDEALVAACLDAGATTVTMPADDVSRSVNRLCAFIHERQARAGVFVNPADPIEMIEPYARTIDRLIVLAVDPGFGGQRAVAGLEARLCRARELRERVGATFSIEVDGNCGPADFGRLVAAGADAFALGRGLFNCDGSLGHAARFARAALAAAGRAAA